MNVLYYSHSFGSPTTTFIRNETEYFNKTIYIKYLCTEVYCGETQPSYVNVIPFEENLISKKIRWLLWRYDMSCSFKNRKYSSKINSFIKKFKPDVIHCHFGYEALMLLDNLKSIENYKIIMHFHGYDASVMIRKKSYCKKLNFYLSLKNIFTISVNNYFLNVFKNNLKINVANPIVLKCGIDTNTFFNSNIVHLKTAQKRFIQVSSLVEKKGHIYTIKAFKLFKDANKDLNVKLTFTGEGDRKNELLGLVKELGLESDIEFVGTLKPNQVSEALRSADVFLHHSVTGTFGDMEGIPTSIMEAMAMELPIVSTFHSGIPELIENGVNGYLVNEMDIINYAERMKESLNMGFLSINKRKILEEYNLVLHNHKLFEIYKTCSSSF